MTPRAVLLGSIGVLAETSDMQRRAFNLAFQGAGLDWHWEGAAYYALLRKPGGLGRIMDYAAARGQRVNAQALHRAKIEHFRALALAEGLVLRPGVAEVISTAQANGVALGLVSTTVPETLDLMFQALSDQLSRDVFDLVLDRSHVVVGKPAPDCYLRALDLLKLPASDVLAIEDTPESQRAALQAGIDCIAFPGFAARLRTFDPQHPRMQILTSEVIAARLLSA